MHKVTVMVGGREFYACSRCAHPEVMHFDVGVARAVPAPCYDSAKRGICRCPRYAPSSQEIEAKRQAAAAAASEKGASN